MAQVAISAVGAAVGGYFGGPQGAAIGWSLGSIVGSALFGPEGPNVRGPRLDDKSVQSSTQGQPIIRVYGSNRLAGNLIWATDIEEHKHTESVGGAKGGGPKSTTFSYTANFAIGLCEGPITTVLRLWADGKIIYDRSNGDSIENMVIGSDIAENIRIYLGTETQEPDSIIQAVEGVDSTPAYRGLAYLVFDDLELEDFGNRIPNITAEVVVSATADFPGPVAEDRPETTSYALHASGGSPGSYLWQRTDQGVVDYIGNVTEAAGSGPTISFYRLRYTLGGEFLEVVPVSITVTGEAHFVGSAPEAVILRGVVRGASDIYFGVVTEQGAWVAAYGAWVHPGINYPVPLRTPSGEPFASDNGVSQVPGIPPGTVEYMAVGQVYGDAIYALLGSLGGGGSSRRAYKFPYTNGVPATQATEEYEGVVSGGYHDIYVDAAGVWIVSNNESLNNVAAITHLDHDLSFIKTWSIPSPSGQGGRRTGPVINGTQAIVAQRADTDARWWVLDLNDDGTSTIVATGLASGDADEGGYGPILPGVGLLERRQWVTFGIFSGEAVTLASIVADLCERSGLEPADYDVSELEADTVRGYGIAQPQAVRQALEPLQRGYFFDIVESDFMLKFPKRGSDSLVTIAEDELAAHLYGDARPEEIRRNRRQDLELPRRVHVQYVDPDRDYQAGEQWAGRLQTRAESVEIVTLPIVFIPDEARPIADALLYDAWVSRDEYELRLGLEYLYLDAADVIEVQQGNATHFVRLTNTDFQMPGLVVARGVSVRQAAYSPETLSDGALGETYESPAPGASSPTEPQPPVGLEGPSLVVLIDSPLLRDADDNAGIYHAGRGYTTGWRGYGLFKSLDDGSSFTQIDSNFTPALMGLTTDALAAPVSGVTIVDASRTVNVFLNGVPESISDALFYNRTQVAIVGVHGRWEVVAFRDVTLESNGSYTISHLMRGLKGTDHNVGNHAAGDYFIVLSPSTIDRALVDIAEIGVERVYKGVSVGRTLQETDPQNFTLALEGLKPLSPVHVVSLRDSSLNLAIFWRRRTRIGGAWDVAGFTPLGETSESYSIDILNGVTIVRTINISSESASYTAAQQVTDFGSAQATVNGRLYQVSSTVGRGTPRTFAV